LLLCERRGDIPLLVEHFLGVYAGRFKKPVSQLSAEARDALLAYGWPGNIRELENVIERCVLLADDNTIRLRDLSTEVRSTAGSGAGGGAGDDDEDGDPNAPGGLKGVVRERTRALERDLIMKALDQTNTNVTQAARLLKISRKSLQIKMKELGLRELNP
jgi:two-component system response regulator AtoC